MNLQRAFRRLAILAAGLGIAACSGGEADATRAQLEALRSEALGGQSDEAGFRKTLSLAAIKMDAWRRRLVVRSVGEDRIYVVSAGKDGAVLTEDDVYLEFDRSTDPPAPGWTAELRGGAVPQAEWDAADAAGTAG